MSAFQSVPPTPAAPLALAARPMQRNNDPTSVKLKVTWTKDQLKNAPDFQYYKPPARTTTARPGSPPRAWPAAVASERA
jgi:hypothetical protein